MGRRKAKTLRSPKIPVGMSEEDVLHALETLARALDVEVRYEKGDFNGGLCCKGSQKVIFIQKGDPQDKQIGVLARELGAFNLDSIYVMPVLREIIAEEKAQSEKALI